MKIVVTDPIDPGEYELTALSAEPVPEPEPPPAPPEPWLSVRLDLSDDPITLHGATIDGDVFVRLEPEGTEASITAVEFYLDGMLVRTESNPPYDFAGGSATAPIGWWTTGVSDGEHEIVARVLGAGAVDISATFTVSNAATVDPVTPVPEVEPPPSPPPEAVHFIERDEIEWHPMDTAVSGMFVNGDFWVLAGTEIEFVSPGWDDSRGGSMINPVGISETSQHQGYDTECARYSESVRTQFPHTLVPGESLVSTWSWRVGEPGCPAVATWGPRPTIRNAAVLTCLADVPPAGSFRPPYAGTVKPLYNVSTMADLDTLPKWPLPDGAPSVQSVIDRISPLWLNHREKAHASYLRPDENMPSYGREIAAHLGDAMLLLLCNIPLADKQSLAIRLAQIAIDQVAVFDTGLIHGRDGGGISVGWHGAVVIGGYLLGEPAVRDYFVGKHINLTQERSQIARDGQGIYWRERDVQTRAEPGSTGYEYCCTINGYIGHVLAARALGLESSWSHPDTFEYADTWMARAHTALTHWAWHRWHRTLWESTDGGRHAP